MKHPLVVPLIFLAVAGHSTIALAQSPGTFRATGNMTTPRQNHAATLLANGKVLISGGWATMSGLPVWATAELYDPSTRTFNATGNMTAPRHDHTATLLPNGKVLITGGSTKVNSGDAALTSAELYDPTTGTFSPTGDMNTARVRHTATLLNNGNVLITGGGTISNSPAWASAELYDPATETFTAISDMTPAGLPRRTATLLPNGKVLIAGAKGDPSALYDPDTGTFGVTGGTTSADYPVTATLLLNGKVLVILTYENDASDVAEVYDPETGIFSATGKMTTAIAFPTGTLLPDGTVLIAGRDWVYPRYDPFGNFDEIGHNVNLYDFVSGTFVSAMPTQREEGFRATLLSDGTVLMSGGWICCGSSLSTAEIYYPAALIAPPTLLSVSGDGRGQGAILHAGTAQVVSSDNPAIPGDVLEIYCTGLVDGSVIPPQVIIGDRMAEVLFFGKAAGFNINQINVRVPSGVTKGTAIPVRLTYLTRLSNEVTIAIR